MTQTYSYTATRTRTEAVVDEFDLFLRYTTLAEGRRSRILKGVEERWLDAVGVYATQAGKRTLEAEISIDWHTHSDLAVLTPTVSTGLPGWEHGAAPEIAVIGQRFGGRVGALKLVPSFWVRFNDFIRANDSLHRSCCEQIGVSHGSSPPPWRTPPTERSLFLLDLQEVGLALREG